LAGMALIPAVYLLAKRLYGTVTALIAASLTAATPILVYYSVTARGYMLVALFTVLTLILSLYLIHHKNLFAWLAWIIITVLGFYTLPIMFYPFGIMITWMLILGSTGDLSMQYQKMRGLLKYLLVASICAGVLTIICYSPILLKNGILNFFNGATVVNSLSLGAFISSFPTKLGETLDNWRFRTPRAVETILIAGLFLSPFIHPGSTKPRTSLQSAALLFLSLILLAQRPNSMPRIWLWLLPLCLIFSAAGFVGLFQRLFASRITQPFIKTSLAALTVLLILGSSLWYGWQISPKPGQPYGGREVEQITRYLKDIVTPDDVIVPSSFSNAPLWYYARLLGIPNPIYRSIKSRPSYRAYVIVYPDIGDTVEKVILENGPDLVFYNLKTVTLVFTSQNAQVYRVDAFPEVVNKAYGIK
ncbi:MAG TPA: glycosyltransferase family 39 protein, partial [Anaerolinea sp.]|nr:glycosyltransferase family 39 protein [Anaerolinea sp.]